MSPVHGFFAGARRSKFAGMALLSILAVGIGVSIARADFYLVRRIDVGTDFGPAGNNPFAIAYDGTYVYLGGYTAAAPSGNIGIVKVNVSNPTDRMSLPGGDQMANQFRYYGGLVVQNGVLYALCDRPDGSTANTNVRAIDVNTGNLIDTFDGDDALNPGDGIVRTPAGMTNYATGGLALDPGVGGLGSGLSILAYARGRRALLSADDGTTIWDLSTGMIVTDLSPVGGCTVRDSNTWRSHVYDTNGDVYARFSNQVQASLRDQTVSNKISGYVHLTDALNSDGTPTADCGDGMPVQLRLAPSVIGQNLALIQPGTGSAGQKLIIFNDHYSNSGGKTFATTIKMMMTDGSLPSSAVQLLRSDGSALDPATDVPSSVSNYNFAYDAAQDLLLILDFGSRAVLVFSSTPGVPPPPSVTPPLIAGMTQVTVASLGPLTTTATLYRNGAVVASKATGGAASVTFGAGDGIAALVAGDQYAATQTTAGGTSDPSAPRCVVPAALGFFDDFEAAQFQPCWQLQPLPLVLSAAQNHTPGGAQSAEDPAATGGEIGRDLTPTTPTDANPVLFEVYLYHDSGQTSEDQRHFATLANWSGDAYRAGTASDLYSIGLYNAVSGAIETQPFDVTRYQGRRVAGATSDWFNLSDPGCPSRSTGWHKFSIKAGGTSVLYYVDGIRGRKIPATPGSLDSLYLGNQLSSADGMDAYFDDVSVSAVVNHPPTLSLADITAQETIAITPTDEVGHVGGSPADSPDAVELEMTGSLPPGLTATATKVSGSPTATITINGTPASGSAAGSPYTLSLTVTDDLGLTQSGTVTIIIRPPCNAPPEDVDGDSDVDLADFGIFQSCFNGPNRPYALPPGSDDDCKCLDVDPPGGDGDVDLADFGKFQACFNGPNRPPATGCGA
jgi:hypothetical protein